MHSLTPSQFLVADFGQYEALPLFCFVLLCCNVFSVTITVFTSIILVFNC